MSDCQCSYEVVAEAIEEGRAAACPSCGQPPEAHDHEAEFVLEEAERESA